MNKIRTDFKHNHLEAIGFAKELYIVLAEGIAANREKGSERAAEGRKMEIKFEHVLSFHVRDNSGQGSPDDRSGMIDCLESGHAGERFEHYEIIAENAIVNVICDSKPEIKYST